MGEIQLPSHWKVVKLGDVCEFIYGKTLPKSQRESGSIPVYGSNGIIDWHNQAITSSKTIVIGRKGSIGKVNFSLIPCYPIDTTYYIDDVKQPCDLYYLYYSLSILNLSALNSSLAIPGLNRNDAYAKIIYLPPVPEQKTIAHTLRTIQKAKETRQRELELERERKAALMQYLFTHGTRKEPRKQTDIGEIPESWEVVTLDKVCEFLQYGTSKLCDSDTSGIPVLRIPNVIGGEINISDLKFTKPDKKEFKKLFLEVGDLLFVRTNGRKEYLGRCAVFCRNPPQAMFASYLIRVRLKPHTLLPEFVQFYTMTHRGKSYLSGRASNAADGKFNINTQTIKSVLVPVAPLNEQHELIGTLQACDRKIQALEKEIALTDELFHAMLEQLMTGKISTQPLTETYV